MEIKKWDTETKLQMFELELCECLYIFKNKSKLSKQTAYDLLNITFWKLWEKKYHMSENEKKIMFKTLEDTLENAYKEI